MAEFWNKIYGFKKPSKKREKKDLCNWEVAKQNITGHEFWETSY